MASCASPSSHGEVRDGVIVGLEDLGVVEDFVPKRVQSVQGHSDVGGRHPVLWRHNGTTSADGRDAASPALLPERWRKAVGRSVGNAVECVGDPTAAAAENTCSLPNSPSDRGLMGNAVIALFLISEMFIRKETDCR